MDKSLKHVHYRDSLDDVIYPLLPNINRFIDKYIFSKSTTINWLVRSTLEWEHKLLETKLRSRYTSRGREESSLFNGLITLVRGILITIIL